MAHSISLFWQGVSGNIGYNVYRSASANAEAAPALNASPITFPNGVGCTYQDTSVVPGTYFYKVTAVDLGTSLESGMSNEASATVVGPVAPSAPSGLAVTGVV